MSNYSKTTDFAAKDSLPSGDSGKIIRGSEFETEFDAISTAIATKADAADPTFTGTVTIDGLTVNGNTVLGNAATDTVTVTADIASNLIPSADDTYNLGASGAEWNDLYVDGVAYIDTIDGAATSGDFTFTGASYNAVWDTSDNALEFADSAKATFGATGDLQIYHSGTHSFITDVGTGNLYLRGTNLLLTSAAGETYADFTADGAARLYYDGSAKLATTTTGVDVTGTATVDGLTVDGVVDINSSNPQLYMFESDTTDANTLLWGQGSAFRVVTVDDAESSFTQRFRVDHTTGDISFYEDTGTTAKFFWDASAESLGIGTSSPSAPLEISKTGIVAPRITSSDGLGDAVLRFYSGSTYKGQLGWDQSGDNLGFFGSGGSGVPDMVIDSSGNVGIGTSSPGSAFEVVGRIATSGGSADIQSNLFGAGDGSATNPSIRHLNDSDTGFWFPAANTIGFSTAGSEAMRIDSSGNVGIGTSSPVSVLHVSTSSAGSIELARFRNEGQTNNTGLFFSTNETTKVSEIDASGATGGLLALATSGTERMRIDSSGRLLVGLTTAFGAGGTTLSNDGQVFASRADNPVILATRENSDGEIMRFRKDGSSVGSIGSSVGAYMYLSSAGSTGGLGLYNNSIRPVNSDGSSSDADTDLGISSARWKDLYLSGGAYLGGTAAANKLDDYEEGTFTPTLTGSTTSDFTYGTQSGAYTKVGRLVFVTVNISLSSKGTSAGDLSLTNLPFTVADLLTNTSVESAPIFNFWGGVSSGVYGLTGNATQFQTTVTINKIASALTDMNTALSASDIDNDFQIRMSLVYQTS